MAIFEPMRVGNRLRVGTNTACKAHLDVPRCCRPRYPCRIQFASISMAALSPKARIVMEKHYLGDASIETSDHCGFVRYGTNG